MRTQISFSIFISLVLLALCPFTQELHAKTPGPSILRTSEQAKDAFNHRFHKHLSRTPLIQRLYLGWKVRSLRRKTLEASKVRGGYSKLHLKQSLQQLLQKTTLPSVVGYSFLVIGIAGSSAASAGLLIAINPNLKFVPTFSTALLGQLSFLSISLLAPFLEPVSSTIRRFTFSMAKGASPLSKKKSSLEAQSDLINATYTLREQNSTDRILTMRTAIRLNFQNMSKAIKHQNHGRITAELGDAVMLGYHHFRDLNPGDPTILNTVQASSLRSLKDPQRYIQPTLDYIKKHDPNFLKPPARLGEPSPQEYYQQALKFWLQPPVALK